MNIKPGPCSKCGAVQRSETGTCWRCRGATPPRQVDWTEKFWRMVNKTDGCWLWTGKLESGGYGRMTINRRRHLAHRLAYELENGPIPDGMKVLHRCDVRNCVNPAHLFLGTQLDNIADRDTKGRAARGSRNGRYTHPETTVRGERIRSAKLTSHEVVMIRQASAEGWTYSALARRYGVKPNCIRAIVLRRSWKHV